MSVGLCFKQKTAYELRISDWSSDVCSSDLLDQTVLARKEFDSYIEFPGNQVRAGIVEDLAQQIPIQSGERGDSFIIYVGFILTPESSEESRVGKECVRTCKFRR